MHKARALLAAPAGGNGGGAGGFAQPKVRQAKGPVTAPDVLAITSELAIMLRAGLALDNALRVLIDMSHKPSVATLMQGILDAVKGGTPLSRALAQHRELFGDFYINMVRSGEASGQMSAVLDRLVEHMERQRALRDNVISATIYPAILLAVAVLSLIAMLGFVVPQFEKLFHRHGRCAAHAHAPGDGAGPGLYALWPVHGRGGCGRRHAAGALVALALGAALVANAAAAPAAHGALALKYQLTLFSRSLGTLLGNGVPMLTALHIATETVGNIVLQQALARVAPIVKEGGRVVQALPPRASLSPWPST